MLVVVYGGDYWDKVLNLDAMEELGTIDSADQKLFQRADTPEQAFELVTSWLRLHYM